MKKSSFIFLVIIAIIFSFCGPPAESREVMHSRAKTIADSMANLIRTALDEAKMPVTTQTMMLGEPASTPSNNPAPPQQGAGTSSIK
ncbi:MAG: hypothetical protein IPM51_14245 [Sphingobacteriaceae bacterium]|nr:hypothetical protein [Sphingobacteriaceae bacterium]